MNRGDAMEITLDVPQFVDDTVFTDALDESYTASVQNGKLTLNLKTSKARMMINKNID
jgi:hypothetical protein